MSSMSISRKLKAPCELVSQVRRLRLHSRVASRRNEVEKGVDSVVPEARVTLDTRLFGKNVVVLAFKISNNFLETKWGYRSVRHSVEQR